MDNGKMNGCAPFLTGRSFCVTWMTNHPLFVDNSFIQMTSVQLDAIWAHPRSWSAPQGMECATGQRTKYVVPQTRERATIGRARWQ
jgi:hypothetical protein